MMLSKSRRSDKSSPDIFYVISIHMLYELIYSMNSYKNNSKGFGKELADMQGEEDGVVGAVDDVCVCVCLVLG